MPVLKYVFERSIEALGGLLGLKIGAWIVDKSFSILPYVLKQYVMPDRGDPSDKIDSFLFNIVFFILRNRKNVQPVCQFLGSLLFAAIFIYLIHKFIKSFKNS